VTFPLHTDNSASVFAVVSGEMPLIEELAERTRSDRSSLIPDTDGSIALGFNIKSFPSAVVVDGRGRKRAHGIINNLDQAAALLDRVISDGRVQPQVAED
jgi:hypothetical protein